MKKKSLALVLCMALFAVAIVGGSLAYFTDKDAQTNTFTVGNVKVALIEQERNANGTELEAFEQDKGLMPIVGSAQGEKDGWGMPVAANYGDKIINAKNIGKNDEYIRISVAIPQELENVNGNESLNILHHNEGNRFDPNNTGAYNGAGQAAWNPDFQNWIGLERSVKNIDNKEYYVHSYIYKLVVKPDETPASPCFVGVYIDKGVDCRVDADGNAYWTLDGEILQGVDLSKPINIPVWVDAIQAQGFENATAAFAAFDDQN